MKLRIEIDLTTAALRDDAMPEISSILTEIDNELYERGLKPGLSFDLPDGNGDDCATVEVIQ